MIIKSIILGIVEGITEFLPISSTGHLILMNQLLSFSGEFANAFTVIIQAGAILAVILYFRKKLLPPIGKSKDHYEEYKSLVLKVVVGCIPAGVLGILFESYIDKYLFNPITVSVALVVGGILLIITENREKTTTVDNESQITYKKAFIVGCYQCLALIPGMSRSASTIIGGLNLGFSRVTATEYSFYLSIPIILGATIVKAFKLFVSQMILSVNEYVYLSIGLIISFITAYFVIAFLMNYIKKNSFKPFAYYRIVLAIIVILIQVF